MEYTSQILTYQVKIRVEPSIETTWLKWMKTKHVPDVIATGLVRSFQILKPETTAHTYFFHYHFESKLAFETYKEKFAPKLKQHPQDKFPNQFEAERTVFQWI